MRNNRPITNDCKEVIAALRMLKVQTGSFACLGCGHENRCSTNGCAILRAAADLLESQRHDLSLDEPLTQADLDKMNFDKVWLSYGPEPDNGEDALVYHGRIYCIDTLEGAGFEEMLHDLIDGETLDNPSGLYRVYRVSLKKLRNTLPNSPLTLEQLRRMDGKPAYWPEVESWGIISVESVGKWADIPFFCGRKLGVNFQYNIESRGMEVYAYPPPTDRGNLG